MKLAVIGAGNGGAAAAVELTIAGHEVALYGRSVDTIAPFAQDGIRYMGVFGEGVVRPALLSSRIAEVINGAEAAIVCLPTTYGEGIPKILIEAAAGGCPIVAYDVPGCREIVTDGFNGRLVPAGDVSRFAQAIAQLLAEPEQRRRMGAQGRNLVEAEFSQEIVVAQSLAIYSELLAL